MGWIPENITLFCLSLASCRRGEVTEYVRRQVEHIRKGEGAARCSGRSENIEVGRLGQNRNRCCSATRKRGRGGLVASSLWHCRPPTTTRPRPTSNSPHNTTTSHSRPCFVHTPLDIVAPPHQSDHTAIMSWTGKKPLDDDPGSRRLTRRRVQERRQPRDDAGSYEDWPSRAHK